MAAALFIGAEDADALPGRGISESGFVDQISPSALRMLAEVPAVKIRSFAAETAAPTYPGGTLSGLFSRGGLLGRFASGFLGSGLLGLLFGRGVFGGLRGVASYIGLLSQLSFLGVLCWLIWSRWRIGPTPAASALSPRQLADPYLRSRSDLRSGLDRLGFENDEIDAEAAPDERSRIEEAETSTRGDRK